MDGSIVLFLIIASGVVLYLFFRFRARTTTIKSPKIAFCDFTNKSFSNIVNEDRSAFGQLFDIVSNETSIPPSCNILFLYCRIGSDGQVEGSERNLRELIRDSSASVVVIASENPGVNYAAAAKDPIFGKANLVMTIDRNGPAFSQFFSKLFALMKQGKSMPLAWVQLAPQYSSNEHSNCPESIFTCEVGHIIFK